MYCVKERLQWLQKLEKIGMLILIIACVFNVMGKLINKLSLNKEMLSSAQYVYEQNQKMKIKHNNTWKIFKNMLL